MAIDTPEKLTLAKLLAGVPAPQIPAGLSPDVETYLIKLQDYIRRLMGQVSRTDIVFEGNGSTLPPVPDKTRDWYLDWSFEKQELEWFLVPVPDNAPLPSNWYHNDHMDADDPSPGDPELLSTLTQHDMGGGYYSANYGINSSYTIKAVDTPLVISSDTLCTVSPGEVVTWQTGFSQTYGGDNHGVDYLSWVSGTGNHWDNPYPRTTVQMYLDVQQRCWLIKANWSLADGGDGRSVWYYKDWGRTPKGAYKFGWYNSGQEHRDILADGSLPATLMVS